MDEFQQHRVPFGVIFLDIDYFKLVNNSYGHNSGDKVLQMVAKTLQHNMRTDDTVARWGGDEIIALLAGVNRQKLLSVAEKIRNLIKDPA